MSALRSPLVRRPIVDVLEMAVRELAVLSWRASEKLICNVQAAQGGGDERGVECSAEEKVRREHRTKSASAVCRHQASVPPAVRQ